MKIIHFFYGDQIILNPKKICHTSLSLLLMRCMRMQTMVKIGKKKDEKKEKKPNAVFPVFFFMNQIYIQRGLG